MVPTQINVEYWFLAFYNLIFGSYIGALRYNQFAAFATSAWIWIVVIGYILSIAGLFVIVYVTMRIYELRQREKVFYGTLLLAPESAGGTDPRWAHIQLLIGSVNPNDWRTAIIEADILLDEMLARQGYAGDGVGEKLKNVDPADFNTLQNAWEAHKVRNQIAHEGSSFDLSQTLAQRTIGQYQAVFREFDLI